jgi:acetolactate synthase-1/2/3 large subunit
VAQAAEALEAARAPLLVLGGGAAGAPEPARALAEALQAPVLLTVNAKGLLPPGHPLLVGSLLPLPPVRAALAAADVVLAIGTELGETDTFRFGERPEIGGRLIRVDIDPAQLGRNVEPWLGIVADAGLACAALADALRSGTRAGAASATRLRAEALASVPEPYHAAGRMLARIAAALPEAIIVGDSTQPVYAGNLVFDAGPPRSWFNSATGFGTLGYALPAAIGAKLARPDRPVVALTGDGALQFSIGELATAVELRLPLPIVVWNNRGYGEIKAYMRARGIPEIGVDIHTPDFQAVARGFGARALGVAGLDALAAALAEAAAGDGPMLVEIDEAVALGW